MTKHKKSSRLSIDITAIIVVFIVLGLFYLIGHIKNDHKVTQEKKSLSSQHITKNQYSTTDPTSIWVVVNKQRIINPTSFIPAELITPSVNLITTKGLPDPSLQPMAALALIQMFGSAKLNNISLALSGAYVPYSFQASIYGGYLTTQGQAAADENVVRPGYNEAQTGLTADIAAPNKDCYKQVCFADTAAGKWLKANAFKYGYIIRYPEGKQDNTGFSYQPWHFRYVGVPLATVLNNTNQSMEEFFNLPSAVNYKE